jgi:hypothetical protein
MVEIFAGTGGLESATCECLKCGEDCLPHMRAATPPKNWMDLLDRQLLLISSKHWTGKTAVYFGAALAVIALSVGGVAVTLSLVFGPVGAAVAGCAGLVGGAGVGAVRKVARRHQQLPPSSSASHTESEQEDESDIDTPRAA